MANALSAICGMLLLFITFTQIGVGGSGVYVTRYFPFAVILLLLIAVSYGRYTLKTPLNFYIIFVLLFAASISINTLQYIPLLFAFVVIFSTIKTPNLSAKIIDYAYYAMIFNLALYFSEIILNSATSLSFNPTIFNYAGAGRDDVISTWDFSRFAAHHTEPGAFASNLGGLTVISLLSNRKPSIFHWLSLLALVSTLSITALAIASVTILTILITSGFGLKTLIFFALAAIAIPLLLTNILPNFGVNTIDFFNHRLLERGGEDGSILVKKILIDEFFTRSTFDSIVGNRHQACDVCGYSKSLGFGFYTVFEGGFFGVILLLATMFISVYRFAARGVAIVATLILMRAEFFFPQVMMTLWIIAESKPSKEAWPFGKSNLNSASLSSAAQ